MVWQAPPVVRRTMIALVAAATSAIRLGSGGVQSGFRTALAVVEEFGLIDAFYPGRGGPGGDIRRRLGGNSHQESL